MFAPAWSSPEEIVSPLPTLVVDTLTDRILSANALTDALFGSGPVTGLRLSRFIAPNFPALAVFADEVFHRGSAWTRALRLRRGDDSEIPCEIRGQAVQSDPPRLMLTFIDLAEQDLHARIAYDEELTKGGLLEWARASAFFSELERRNRLILDAAGEGIYGLNAEGKTTFVNRAAQEMLGWTSEDLIGSDMHSMIHHHHVNGEVYPAQNCPIYQSFRFEQVHRIEDEVFWRKDANPIPVEYVSTPIYDRGVLAGAVISFRDITERKESEKKLRRAMAEIAKLRDRLEQENAYLQEEILEERAHHDIVGTSVPVRHMISRLELAAQLVSNILITGEPDTGKSLLAAAIHKDSERRRRPLIQLKCSTVPAQAREVELFGQVRGAFADRHRMHAP